MIRLMLVVANRVYRELLGVALEVPNRFTVVGTASTGEEALGLLHDRDPDVVLIELPKPNGLALLRSLLLAQPQVTVVPLGLPNDEAEILTWAEAGAAGFPLQDGSLEDLRLAVEGAARGEFRCSPALVASFVRRLRALAVQRPSGSHDRIPLTVRERQIVSLIDQGFANKEIARRLGIEVATVKNHVHNILRKLPARGRIEAAARVAGRFRRSS